jgi:hypothetical protein
MAGWLYWRIKMENFEERLATLESLYHNQAREIEMFHKLHAATALALRELNCAPDSDEKIKNFIDRFDRKLETSSVFDCMTEIQKLKDLMIEKTPTGKDKLSAFAKRRMLRR